MHKMPMIPRGDAILREYAEHTPGFVAQFTEAARTFVHRIAQGGLLRLCGLSAPGFAAGANHFAESSILRRVRRNNAVTLRAPCLAFSFLVSLAIISRSSGFMLTVMFFAMPE